MLKSLKDFSTVLFLGLFVISCAGEGPREGMPAEQEPGTTSVEKRLMQDTAATSYTSAVAVMHPTEGNDVSGTITFEQSSEGVEVHAEVSGLPEGKHGFHIHLYGDCRAPDGTSAGTHFNFEGSSKNPPKNIKRITGNLGNLDAGSNGEATADTVISNAKMNGPKSIIGRAVIVHEKPNDPSQPPIGAAGSRLSCGVIGIANPEAVTTDQM